jgi:acetoin utilization deacetylase AcuC-like enzyme
LGRCTVISDPSSAQHDNPSHPECNARLDNVFAEIPGDIPWRTAGPASLEDVSRVHDLYYLSWLAQRCTATAVLGWLDSDTYITRNSYTVALHAAGAAIEAVERSLDGEHCFALVRPPGHHAEPDRAMGFCLVNNVAVAVKKALMSVDRIAVVDWDVHHGTGTQHAFCGSDRVLYCSVHQEHYFPYTGSIGETGVGSGKGYTINAPLQAGSTIADYGCVFFEVFGPAIERFAPDAVVVSAGQDILFDDPLGMMEIRPQDFEILTHVIAQAAGVPIALVLEGGYGPSHGAAIRHIFSALRSECGIPLPQNPCSGTREMVALLKKVHGLA